jgi:hypothetical protein
MEPLGIHHEAHECDVSAEYVCPELGVLAAEAFVHLNRDHHTSDMPGL